MTKIVETPRDAFQSLAHFIPTAKKIEYINALLNVGFHTVEVGSFVSPRAIPQLSDTAEVVRALDVSAVSSRIMVLAANRKGVESACAFEQIHDISYPFSASPTFIKKNICKTQIESLLELEECRSLCEKHNKHLIAYITMGFGNPYGDDWNVEMIMQWAETLLQLGVDCIPLSDITGEADETKIHDVYTALIPAFPGIEFGLHLHSQSDQALPKLGAAWDAGCRRFDSVMGGYGGCPMTGKEMMANLDTAALIAFLATQSGDSVLNEDALKNIPDFKFTT